MTEDDDPINDRDNFKAGIFYYNPDGDRMLIRLPGTVNRYVIQLRPVADIPGCCAGGGDDLLCRVFLQALENGDEFASSRRSFGPACSSQ